jgi:hypothetical protein
MKEPSGIVSEGEKEAHGSGLAWARSREWFQCERRVKNVGP